MTWATERAEKGSLSAGDLVWSQSTSDLMIAIVLEPEVLRERCGEIVFVAMVALGDAVGAQIPAEIGIHYQWPGTVLMNNGRIGFVDLIISEGETDGIPEWMVLGIDFSVLPDMADLNPGLNVEITTMWEEGCGDITRNDLLESIARHMLAVLHSWSEDGFSSIHQQWTGRLFEQDQLALGVGDSTQFMGLDENGNAILSGDDCPSIISVADGLSVQREIRLTGK